MYRTILITSIILTMNGMLKSQDHAAQRSPLSGAPTEVVTAQGTTVPVFNFEGFRPNLHRLDDTLYVINFWATWCKPCIEELPGFLDLKDEYRDKKVAFIFVSLDFRRNLESSVIPFIQDKGMSGVALLHDPDADRWISQVDENWSGAIPATLVYRNDKRVFREQSLSYDELKSIINSFNQ